ncbi:putative pentatricopeptide repeat-containing protein [Nymphaea thermarum]|nr:putative pentatricopeptide repeat-containing protein [Nymphaea thermarum]
MLGKCAAEWNSQLKLYAQQGRFFQALQLYRHMQLSGVPPDGFTFPFAIKSCAALQLPKTGEQLHSCVIRIGCGGELFVRTALIAMYARFSRIRDAREVFDEMPRRQNLVSWNALIAGYNLNKQPLEALVLFRQMHIVGIEFNSITMLGLVPACAGLQDLETGRCLHGINIKNGADLDESVANCFITMYARCGDMHDARRLFDALPERNIITWNALISGYSQNGHADDVLCLYREMEKVGVEADAVGLVCILSACASLGAQSIGRRIHEHVIQKGFQFNVFLMNAFINMYARCGNLELALKLFDEMPQKNIVSWTAIINGYGMHGLGDVAIDLFDRMVASGIQADSIAFVSVLSACSHAGLVDKAWEYLKCMKKNHGLEPRLEHYACMVDVLGRAGQINEAMNLIDAMPMKPDGAVWGALLGACKIHRNVEIAELAAANVFQLEPTNVGYYVLLSNIYAGLRNYEGMARVRCMMRERGLRKPPGCSYIELQQRVHIFLAGDRSHPQAEAIYKMLDRLEELLKEAGYVADMSEALYDDKDSEYEMLAVHSERLAIAFGLMNSEPGTRVLVIKNLRVCIDCHTAIKFISKVVEREIVVRDATRFHHFWNGDCSCKDFW